jgi:uncharacterized membrane protein
MPIPLIPIITGIFGIAGNWLKGMTARRNKKIEHKTKMAEMKLQLKEKVMIAQVTAEIDLDKINTESMASSWKDEFLLLLFSIPVVMCFIPGLAVYVTAGFIALSGTPVWYQVIFVVIALTVYGHRKLAKIFANKFMGK